MINITIYSNTSGMIVANTQYSLLPDNLNELLSEYGNVSAIEGIYDADTYYVNLETLQPTLLPPKPSIHHIFNYITKEWEDTRPLEALKQIKWSNLKSQRDMELYAPLNTSYGTFDADPKSQKAITDAILLLQTMQSLGSPTTIDFTLSDNSTTTLDLSQMVEVGMSLGSRTQQIYANYRNLRGQLDAAETKEAVESITT